MAQVVSAKGMARQLLVSNVSYVQTPALLTRAKGAEMELVMGGLLIGMSAMLALLFIAARKGSAARPTDIHASHRGT